MWLTSMFQSRAEESAADKRRVTGMAYTAPGGKKRVCYYYDGKRHIYS